MPEPDGCQLKTSQREPRRRCFIAPGTIRERAKERWEDRMLTSTGHPRLRPAQSTMPYAWSGFEESFAWIRQHTATDALLATAYDPMYYLYTGRRAIRPALHRSVTYFYPYGNAHPDVGSVEVIKPQLDKLKVGYLVIDPMDGYAEGNATLRLFDGLVAAYGDRAKNVFTSMDGKHRIYALAVD